LGIPVAAHPSHAHGPAAGDLPRIGPNAITRVASALNDEIGAEGTATLFRQAGLARYLETPPGQMVDEREVVRLHQVLRNELGLQRARTISWEAGRRTADYLLAVRIPKPAQLVLKLLPAVPASRILLKAVGKHSWTFAGSGHFQAEAGPPVRLTIANCPICRAASDSPLPLCDFYAAVFEHLFRTLVTRHARVVETACHGAGAPACVFDINW